MPAQQIHQLARSCLLLGYVGPRPPSWLLDALGDGLGGVVLFGSNLGDGTDVRTVTDALRAAAGGDVVIALDEEGGDVTRLDTRRGSAFPGAAALGHLDDVSTTEEVYAAIGARLAEAGVSVDLAPVADVNVDPLNPVIGLRSFGSDADQAARHVTAAVRGLQRNGIAACTKHFPGHGATRSDSHHEVATLHRSRHQLEQVEFATFRAAIAAGARAIMTGHLVAPALDDRLATISATITTHVLRGELGFRGAVVTDALEMKALAGTVGLVEGFVLALIAGADAIESGALDYPELVDAIPRAVEQAVSTGRLSEDRLHDAAHRARQLARPGAASTYDQALVASAARRSLELLGAPPRLHRPLVVECHPPGGMASGELPWSLGDVLAERTPGTETVRVDGETSSAADTSLAAVAARSADRTLVVVVRDPMRHPWQEPWIKLARTRPGAVVVDVGWPDDSIAPVPCIRTRGIAPGLLAAAAAALAEAGAIR